jgi:NadR type nicotinamide-nucleotide adenylyltransferase
MHVIKVAITGPESTGKSMLSQALAAHYMAPWAREFARDYLKKTRGVYTIEDLVHICEGQISLEEKAISDAEKICFFDTDMLVLKVWAHFRFGTVPMRIEQAHAIRQYHISLLCKPDLDWTPDPYRESPDADERMLLYNMYKSHLKDAARPFIEIEGQGERRLQLAIAALDDFIGKFRAHQI